MASGDYFDHMYAGTPPATLPSSSASVSFKSSLESEDSMGHDSDVEQLRPLNDGGLCSPESDHLNPPPVKNNAVTDGGHSYCSSAPVVQSSMTTNDADNDLASRDSNMECEDEIDGVKKSIEENTTPVESVNSGFPSPTAVGDTTEVSQKEETTEHVNLKAVEASEQPSKEREVENHKDINTDELNSESQLTKNTLNSSRSVKSPDSTTTATAMNADSTVMLENSAPGNKEISKVDQSTVMDETVEGEESSADEGGQDREDKEEGSSGKMGADTTTSAFTPVKRGRPPNRHKRRRTPKVSQHLDPEIYDTGEEDSEPHPVQQSSWEIAFRKRVVELNPTEEALYTAPFKEGWRREVVIRGVYNEVSSTGKKKMPPADVYYHPPKGTGSKIRSMVQVADWLHTHKNRTELTQSNFSFMRKPIWKPPQETIRSASMSRGRAQARKPEVVIERDSDNDYAPAVSKVFNTSTSTSPLPESVRRIKPSVKRSLPLTIKSEVVETEEKVETLKPSNQYVVVSPPKKKLKPTARKSTTQKSFKPTVNISCTGKKENLCSLTCPGLEGVQPSLHCDVCMCLFHTECVNFKGSADKKFVCQRCVTVKPSSNGVLINSIPSPSDVVSHLMTTPPATTIQSPNLHAKTVVFAVNTSTPVSSGVSKENKATEIRKELELSFPGSIKVKTEPPDTGEYGGSWQDNIKIKEVLSQSPLGNQASPVALGSLKNILDKKNMSQTENRFQPRLPVVRGTFHPQGIPTVSQHRLLFQPTSLINGSLPAVVSNSGVLAGLSGTPLNSLMPGNVRLVPVGTPVRDPVPGLKFQIPRTSPQVQIAQSTATVTKVTTAGTTSARPILPSTPSTSAMSIFQLTPPTTTVACLGQSSVSSSAVTLSPNVPLEVNHSRTGQMLTLPQAVTKRLCLTKPLALKINNMQVVVPPSGFFSTPEGLKVFLPPLTFPSSFTGSVCVTVTNEKEVPKTMTTAGTGGTNSTSVNPDTKTLADLTKNSEKHSMEEINISSEAPPVRRSLRKRPSCFIQKLYGGFECMHHIFQYLNLRDLISVGQVCRSWRELSQHPCLWKDVSFHSMKVPNWLQALKFLAKKNVEGILLFDLNHYDDANRTWHQLISALPEIPSLKRIYFGLVPALVLNTVCEKLVGLETFCAECISDFSNEMMWTSPTKIDIGKFASLSQLRELKLKGVRALCLPSFSFTGGLQNLASLKNLRVLSLTSMKNLSDNDFQFLSDLTQLEELALGDCDSWTSETFFRLGQLKLLRRLRLERGGGLHDNNLSYALHELTKLERLELYMYTVVDSLGVALMKLLKLKTLIVWPDNSHQPAQVNSNTLTVVKGLTNLKRLEWVIPNTSNASIILDTNDNPNTTSKTCLPDSRPEQWIPFLREKNSGQSSEVDIEGQQYITVAQLTRKLVEFLPKTAIKVTYIKHDGNTKLNQSHSETPDD